MKMRFKRPPLPTANPCSIYISSKPGARNLNESRRILAALQQKFGEVVEFRNQKHDPTTIFKKHQNRPITKIYATFLSPEAADSAVNTKSITVGLDYLYSFSVHTILHQLSNPHEPTHQAKHPEIFLTCAIQRVTPKRSTFRRSTRNPFHKHFAPDKHHPIWKDMMNKLDAEGGLKALADAPLISRDPARSWNRGRNDSAEAYCASLMKVWQKGLEDRATVKADKVGPGEMESNLESESGKVGDLMEGQG
ncbi:uncharacterized protein BDV14DRAFT_120660 [Aspergillus stella-maris]|uniref:uncharacterized protein n=1 Tax=Aspergillus stella-maris TaxID=1810926 RepID=UPI003CCE25CE